MEETLMKLSKMLTPLVAALMLLSLAGSAFADPWFGSNRRDCNSNNFRRGNITRQEAWRLRQNAQKVNRYQHAAYADGRISPAERQRLARLRAQQRLAFHRALR
jgi:hypothetical protein